MFYSNNYNYDYNNHNPQIEAFSEANNLERRNSKEDIINDFF